MLGKMLENVRKTTPIVHNITNYVTVNDCANILLACGASPIMSDDIDDVCDITAVCSALNINIGTLNQRTIPSMLAAGKESNKLNHPVLLDPVGAGASRLRTETAKKLIDEVHFSVIKGNISEIKTLALGIGTTKGVDADIADSVTEKTIDNVICFAREFSEKTGAVIVITGATDLVVDKTKAFIITNGNAMMSKITGTGCMLSAMMSAYIGANPDNIPEACAAAVCAMGLCGEKAFDRLGEKDGNSTYRNMLIDEIYNLDAQTLRKGAKYEMR